MPAAIAHADWVNLTGAETAANVAEIRVLDDRVAIALEASIEDVAAFGLAGAADDVALRVLDEDGRPLSPVVVLREQRPRKDRYSPFAGAIDPRTGYRLPEAPTGDVLYAEIEYAFEGRPPTLVFVPPLDEAGRARVTIGFLAYHKAAPINDFRYLSQPEPLHLDWADPWYTRFENRNLRRHHASPLMSFLYVEPREVRHEVLVRVRDLIAWTGLDAPDGGTLTATQAEALRARAEAFFPTRNPLSIDGVASRPDRTRVAFLEITPAGLRVVQEGTPIDVAAGIAGASLAHRVAALPERVTVAWDLVTDATDPIPSTVSDPAGPLPSFLEPGETTIEWQSFLRTWQEPVIEPVATGDHGTWRLPLLSIVLLGVAVLAASVARRSQPAVAPRRRAWTAAAAMAIVAALATSGSAALRVPDPFAGPPRPEEAARIGGGLLDAARIAYLEKNEDARARALTAIVTEDALQDVTRALDRAFAIAVSGGGIASVDAMREVDAREVARLDGRDGFAALLAWNADASARHWGHVDRRSFRFRAFVEVVDAGGFWKLSGLTVVDAKAGA